MIESLAFIDNLFLDALALMDILASVAASPKYADKLWDIKVAPGAETASSSAVSVALRLCREWAEAPKTRPDVHTARVMDTMLTKRVRGAVITSHP